MQKQISPRQQDKFVSNIKMLCTNFGIIFCWGLNWTLKNCEKTK